MRSSTPIGYAGLNLEIVESAYTALRTIGKDKRWLHQWIKYKREETEEDQN
jgi:hypothetical protein